MYIVLVGDANLTIPGETTGTIWADVLSGLKAADIKAQVDNDTTETTDDLKFAIFLIKETTTGTGTSAVTTYKAVAAPAVGASDASASDTGVSDTAAPDIAAQGIMNETETKKRVTLRKADKVNGVCLEGAKFRIFRSDLTEVINSEYDKTNQCYTSKMNGIYFMDELPYGRYYLVETVAPTKKLGEKDNTNAYESNVNVNKVFVLTVDDQAIDKPSTEAEISGMSDENPDKTTVQALIDALKAKPGILTTTTP